MYLIDDIVILSIILFLFIYWIRRVYLSGYVKLSIYYTVLSVFHLVIGLLSLKIDVPDDAIRYYSGASTAYNPGFNSQFIERFIRLISKAFLDLSFLTTSVIIGFIGLVGFIFLTKLLCFENRKMDFKFLTISTVLFLPSIHYWSGMLSKEAFLISLIILSVYAFVDIKKKWPLFTLSVFLIAMMRPHYSGLLLCSGLLTLLLNTKLQPVLKFGALSIGLLLLYFLSYNTMIYFGFDGLTIDTYKMMVERWRGSVSGGSLNNTNLDLGQLTFIERIFSFLFRPIFSFDNIKLAAISFENIIILFAMLSLVRASFIRWIKQAESYIIYAGLTFIFLTVFMSQVSSNYGYAIRQKSTFLPLLLLLVISFWLSQLKTNETFVESSK